MSKQNDVLRDLQGKPQYRAFHVEQKAIDEEARTVRLAFSSETEYERDFGIEILDHDEKSIRLGRMTDGAAFLVNHNTDDQVGVIDQVEIGQDRIGRALVRFGESDRAEDIWRDIVQGIRKHVSVGYFVHGMELDEKSKDGPSKYRVTDWEPFEASIVPVPADPTVGVGRSAEIDQVKEPEKQKEPEMADEKKTVEVPEVDVNKITEDARSAENQRMRDIDKLGEKHNQRDLANEFKNSNRGVDEFRVAILEKMDVLKPIDASPEIGMSKKEIKEFKFLNAINAMANPGDRSFENKAAFERECSEEAAKKMGRQARGMYIPYDVLNRDMTVGTDADGGYLVGTDHGAGSFIDVLRNKAMVLQMGARTLTGLQGDVAIPKLSSGHTGYWLAEDGAPTVSTPGLGQLALSPKTVGAFSNISRLLTLQGTPDAEAMVRGDIAETLALSIDLAALHGTGADNQPTGIAATSDVGSVAGGTNGLAPAWSHIVGLETAVAVDNADGRTAGYLTNSAVRGKLKQVFINTTGGDTPLWTNLANGDGWLNGYKAGVSNQVSSALTKGTSSGVCSAIFFSGAWERLIVAMWGSLDLMVNPYILDTTGQIRVTGFQSVDIGIRTPESFSVMLDALTT